MVDALPPLRDVITRHGLGAKKSLGQHFLLDLNLTGRIARAAGDLSQGTVIEIGPGPGGLTRAILEAGARRLIVIERDDRCLEALAEIQAVYPGRLEIIADDAMSIDVATLGEAPRRIIANLPYNSSTALTVNWLKSAHAFECMVLMYQKEVVDRLAAVPRTSDYGRLSVITQWLCHVEPQFRVDRRAFTPPPNVTSTVVKLVPREVPLAESRFEDIEKVTAAAICQKRKKMRYLQ